MLRLSLSVLALAAGVFITTKPALANEAFTLELAAGNSKYEGTIDSATALGITGRYTWASGFGLEAGVRAHGEFLSLVDSGDTLRTDVTSYLVGLSYELPLGPVTLGARLGGHAWRERGNLISPSSVWLSKVEDSGTGLYHSLALSYALSERSSIGLARSEYRISNGYSIKSTDIRFAYRF